MQREEAALQAWLNSLLAPVKDGVVAQQAALAGRRLTARMRGLLWHLYSRDAELAAVMMRVEARIDSGHLRIRDEVCTTSVTCQQRVGSCDLAEALTRLECFGAMSRAGGGAE